LFSETARPVPTSPSLPDAAHERDATNGSSTVPECVDRRRPLRKTTAAVRAPTTATGPGHRGIIKGSSATCTHPGSTSPPCPPPPYRRAPARTFQRGVVLDDVPASADRSSDGSTTAWRVDSSAHARQLTVAIGGPAQLRSRSAANGTASCAPSVSRVAAGLQTDDRSCVRSSPSLRARTAIFAWLGVRSGGATWPGAAQPGSEGSVASLAAHRPLGKQAGQPRHGDRGASGILAVERRL